MNEFYVTQIRLGKMLLSEVPIKWQSKVEEALKS